MIDKTAPISSQQFPSPQIFARTETQSLAASKIRQVANAGMGQSNVLGFWFGEPYQPTHPKICQAAIEALKNGDTFYQHNLGVPKLRETLATYLNELHPRANLDAQRVVVTSSGVNALMLCAQAILSPNDRVVVVTPLWPNIVEIPKILGAKVYEVSLELEQTAQGIAHWHLNLQALIAQLTPNTKAVIINSPNNPTGWMMSQSDQQILVKHCREHGIWIVSDEAYDRLAFNGLYQAPSFLDCTGPTDRLLVANTFSKTWQMTGWRLGWIVTPYELTDEFSKLIEFNTSCAPGFIQQAGLAAIAMGPEPIHLFVNELQQAAQLMQEHLGQHKRISLGVPDGAMYVFLKIDGITDSLQFATNLVKNHGVGLAPGIAFGPTAEGYLRWCFAKPAHILIEGLTRFKRAL